jgi:hypothetical protein
MAGQLSDNTRFITELPNGFPSETRAKDAPQLRQKQVEKDMRVPCPHSGPSVNQFDLLNLHPLNDGIQRRASTWSLCDVASGAERD